MPKMYIFGLLPPVLQSLDVKAQGGGDGADVFTVKFLQNGGFSSVVQTSARPH